jgi:hypothetical protein
MGAIDRFLASARGDPELAPCVADLADALQRIDFEGDGNREAAFSMRRCTGSSNNPRR